MENSEDGHLQVPGQAMTERVLQFATNKDVSAFADLAVREWKRWCVSGLHRVYCLRGGRPWWVGQPTREAERTLLSHG